MSFKTQSLFVKQIENEIEDNKLSLEDILSKVNLSIILNQKLPKLTNFLILHVRDIIEYSFVKDTDELIKSNSYSILSDFQPVRNLISKDPNLINLLFNNFLNGTENMIPLINLLRRIIEVSNALALHKVDQSSLFFQNLLNNMNKIYIREFLDFLFSYPNLAPFRKWFYDLKAEDLLYQKINKDESGIVQEKVLTLLSKYVLMVDKDSIVLQKLASKEIISYILQLGLNSTKISLSCEAFKYIFLLNQSISESEKLKTNFLDIQSLLIDNCENLCIYVQHDHKFFNDKRYSIELIILALSFKKKVSKFIINFLNFLLNLFTRLKTNTFLHTSFLKLFKVLSSYNIEFINFVNSSKIMNLIPSLIDQKEVLCSSYWGHIYEMTIILVKLLKENQDELECYDEWKSYCESTFKVQCEIIKRSYGGSPPMNESSDYSDDSSSSDSSFYKSHFVDSCDLLSRVFDKHSSSSSSDSSEESEEEEVDSNSTSSTSDSNAEDESD